MNKIQEQFKTQFPALKDFIIGSSIPTIYRVKSLCFYSLCYFHYLLQQWLNFWWNNIHMIISIWTWVVTNYIYFWGRKGAVPSSTLWPFSYASKAPITNMPRLWVLYHSHSRRKQYFLCRQHMNLCLTSGLLCQGRTPLDKQASHELLLFQFLCICPSLGVMQEGFVPSGREHSLIRLPAKGLGGLCRPW